MEKGLTADEAYVQQVLPRKMAMNLKAVKSFGVGTESHTLLNTVFAMLGSGSKRKEEV